jgi:hypothetical protein
MHSIDAGERAVVAKVDPLCVIARLDPAIL